MLILNKSGRSLPLCSGCKDNVVYIINQIFHHFFRLRSQLANAKIRKSLLNSAIGVEKFSFSPRLFFLYVTLLFQNNLLTLQVKIEPKSWLNHLKRCYLNYLL